MRPKTGKRKNQRQTCGVPVEGKAGTGFGNTQTVDISSKGVGLLSREQISVNERIAIEIQLTLEKNPVLVLGQVQWVNRIQKSGNYRVGVKFSKALSTGSRGQIGKHFR